MTIPTVPISNKNSKWYGLRNVTGVQKNLHNIAVTAFQQATLEGKIYSEQQDMQAVGFFFDTRDYCSTGVIKFWGPP